MNKNFTKTLQVNLSNQGKRKNLKHSFTFPARIIFSCIIALCSLFVNAQTSWKGTTSTAWATSGNWTNGVPSSSVDAIIGDRSITNYPVITATATCKSLTLGNGTYTGKLTLSQNLTASGNITIGTTGTLTQNSSTLTLTGNWSNSGTYNATTTSANIIFSGTAQTVGGSILTYFKTVTINSTSTVTLNKDMNVETSINVNGTFDPNENPGYLLDGNATLTVGSTGTVQVNAATADLNYSIAGAVLNNGSTIEYASTTVNQTIFAGYPYSTLKISGTGIKSLSGDVSILAPGAAYGNLMVAGGTLDMNAYNADRGTTVAGGTLSIANGAKIIIEGDNSLPLHYATITLSTGSTIEYAGTLSQSITAANYYNLTSSSTGARVLPSTGTVGIAGTFTPGANTYTTTGSTIDFNGTSAQTIPAFIYKNITVSGGAVKTAGANFSVEDALTLGANTTLALSAYNITLKSTSTNTARVATIPTTASVTYGTGRFVVERYISSNNNRAYRLLSPSVITTTSIKANWQENSSNTSMASNINPNPGYGTQITGSNGSNNGFDATTTNATSMYSFTQGTGAWASVTNTATPTFTGKAGYLLYIRGDRSINMSSSTQSSNTTLRTTGQLLTGDQVYNSLASNGAFSLIANPYASPINWNSIYSGTATTNFENYYTYWDPNVGSRGGYVTVTNGGLVSPATTATTQIQTGQAVFIKTKAGINSPSLTITESQKSSTNNINIFSPTQLPQTMSISLYSPQDDGTNPMVDGVLAAYNDNYSAGVDDNDALEIGNWDENVAITREGKMLSIETRPYLTAADTIPLSIARLKVKQYEWQINPTNLTGANLQAFLVDNFTITNTPLTFDNLNTISFAVTSDPASSAANRFMIVFAPYSVLPVTITGVKASEHNNGIMVEWKTENETNINKYEVEKSLNGNVFTKLGEIKSLNSLVANNYSLFDANPANGNNFYRIKTTDNSGVVKYTAIVKVNLDKTTASDITIYPNPVQGKTFQVQLSNFAKGNYTLIITNNAGQKVYSKDINHSGGTLSETIETPSLFPAGIYNLKVQGTNVMINKQLYKK